MRLEQHKNFISAEEIILLNNWVDEGVSKKWLSCSSNRGDINYSKRLTSRMYSTRYTYPEIVGVVSNRVRSFCNVLNFDSVYDYGQNGVVVNCIFNGGEAYPHQDPTSGDGLAALRCNILTRSADAGGILHVDNLAIPLEVGELHCYLASEHQHYVSEVVGDTSRVMWMFGAYVPKEMWNNGTIKFGISK